MIQEKIKVSNSDENFILQKVVQFSSNFDVFLDKVSGKNVV